VLTASVYPSNWTSTGTVTAPSASSVTITYGNGTVTTTQGGTSALPFEQTTLTASSITDPGAFVRSSTTDYNLTWGTPDKIGPGYTSLFPNVQSALASPIFYMGRSVTSVSSSTLGPTLTQPATDVLSAWNQGWTGKGKNVLMVDSFAASTIHGINTMMITNLTAPGASLFALEYSTNFNGLPSGTAKNIDNINLTAPASINVVNASFGMNWISNGFTSNYGEVPTFQNYLSASESSRVGAAAWKNFFSGVSNVGNLNNVDSAVIVKSAGNDGLIAGYDFYTAAYASDASIQPRLLVVGALNKDGSLSNKATISNYSNMAGYDLNISNRFVVANGSTPYLGNAVAINSANANFSSGTSYAAPRVSAYAAIIMQKFPNIDAIKTSSIILDTARTDTLSCSPYCSSAIYGKGEASLSRALAPVGNLR
jgi:hypothetical protein